MKKILTVVLAIAAMSATQAMAAQYQVYVTSATTVSGSPSDLGSLVQKDIRIDTTANLLTINLAPACTGQMLCPHFMRVISLPITQVAYENGNLSLVKAVGSLDNSNDMTTLQITLNANNATDITVVSGSGGKTSQSSFTGGPATPIAETN